MTPIEFFSFVQVCSTLRLFVQVSIPHPGISTGVSYCGMTEKRVSWVEQTTKLVQHGSTLFVQVCSTLRSFVQVSIPLPGIFTGVSSCGMTEKRVCGVEQTTKLVKLGSISFVQVCSTLRLFVQVSIPLPGIFRGVSYCGMTEKRVSWVEQMTKLVQRGSLLFVQVCSTQDFVCLI